MKTEVSRAAPYELKYFKYSSHYWILKFLAVSNRPLRILDVGTANGYLGAILGNLGHSIVGVEKDPNFATKAARFYQSFHITDIETFEFPFKEEFDLILFADVLEHLRDPSHGAQTINEMPKARRGNHIIGAQCGEFYSSRLFALWSFQLPETRNSR